VRKANVFSYWEDKYVRTTITKKTDVNEKPVYMLTCAEVATTRLAHSTFYGVLV
jgi:hypothetical protein